MLGPPLPLTLPGSVVLRAAKSIRWKKGWRRWYKRLTGSLPVGCYRLHYFSNTDVISCFQSCALATPFVGGYLITKIVRTRYYLRQGFTMSRPHSLVGCSNVVHMSTSAQIRANLGQSCNTSFSVYYPYPGTDWMLLVSTCPN